MTQDDDTEANDWEPPRSEKSPQADPDSARENDDIDLDEFEGDDIEIETGGNFEGVRAAMTILTILVVVGIFAGPYLFRLAFGKTYGKSCTEGMDCRSGVCLTYNVSGNTFSKWTTNEGICSYSCRTSEDCPADSRCFAGEHCAPKPTAEAGDSCQYPWECRTGKCVFAQKPSPSGPMGTPPGLSDYEDTGECITEETLQKRREAREKMRELRDKMKNLQRNLK